MAKTRRPLPVLLPPPVSPSPAPLRGLVIKNPRALARRLMRSAGDGPLPVLAQHVQERAREEVRTLLRDTGLREHRLYVLEIAGRYPCIKIG